MDYKIKLTHLRQSSVLTKTPQDAQGFLACEIAKNFAENDILFIAKNDAEMNNLHNQIQFFNANCEILNFYAWDCLPYDRASPKAAISANRIKTLYRLSNRKEGEKFFIITSINSIIQKTISPSKIKDLGLFLQVGSKISLKQISDFLINKGYERQVCANNVGEFAVRGGIIDIVLTQAADLIGYRIDFFGDEIESIKIFDPLTQITAENVKTIEILPNSEAILHHKNIETFRQKYRQNFGNNLEDPIYQAISDGRTHAGMEHWLPFFYEENLAGFSEYLKNPICFFDEEIFQLANSRSNLIKEYYQSRLSEVKIRDNIIYNPIASELLYFDDLEIKNSLENLTYFQFNKFDCSDNSKRIIDLEIRPIPDFALAGRANQRDPIELMKEFTSTNQKAKTIICALSDNFKERITKIFPDYGIKSPIFVLPMHFGFYTSDFFLIGEQAIFGEKLVRKRNNKAASQRLIEEGLSISENELVVHRDHGIGRFKGINLIDTGGVKVDMIKIEYGGSDILYVPVDDINLITRYGSDNPLIQLDRLGVATWKNRRERVRKRIKVAAEELLKIAAARKLRKASTFIPDQHFYDEFKNRFGFVETEDQANAISEVEDDLAKGSPMDRLICGDVGFGKTEVAMRAAAVVVSDNKNNSQIAIVAPTTLLCRQHYKNFIKRFEGTNIKVAQLSRLVTPSQAKEIKTKIESGEVQIVIGTHALLQKTIKFKNLGLVIIDEEQHFGVAQKERLKELRSEVHVLTLSATPIPRTLQMSLTGVKDLSLISTPPIDRLAVRNFVMPYDSMIVREAVMREYNRGGKVFFVVPRVRDIEEIEPRLKILLPEIKITHAHGQMNPSELDKIMNEFVDGKIDMLLSTTIIESGIDISEANTMIIYKAEMFGLSQLYQLRGRVGRGKLRAYCYFMLDNRKKVSKDSQKKLEVMQNLDSLGIGFSVASHDMDIRGSGNILGDEQSGHIKETGVELYQQMLLETIEKLKNSPKSENTSAEITHEIDDFSTQVKLGISLLIPEDYMPDLSLRMSFYKKIANIKNDEDQESLNNEMTDRFGKIPSEIYNLMEISKLKFECKKLGIERIESNSQGTVISFKDNKFSNPEALMKMISESKGAFKIIAGQKILYLKLLSKVENSVEYKINSAFEVVKKISTIL